MAGWREVENRKTPKPERAISFIPPKAFVVWPATLHQGGQPEGSENILV
jgi:hypothetical protein